MKTKPVIPRELAGKDAEDAVDDYLQEAGDQVALGFIESLQKIYNTLAGIHKRALHVMPTS